MPLVHSQPLLDMVQAVFEFSVFEDCFTQVLINECLVLVSLLLRFFFEIAYDIRVQANMNVDFGVG